MYVTITRKIRGITKGENMAILKDLSGDKYNMLEVLYLHGRQGERRRALYMCKCDCGELRIVKGENLRSGAVKSCGCLRRLPPPNKTHGKKNHLLYGVWQNMKNRCYNKNVRSYESYGERGVTVCADWLHDFAAFYDWSMENGWKRGLEVDRKDNGKGYSPGNCRIVTRSRNLTNKGLYQTNKTGFAGISIMPDDRLRSSISVSGKMKHLGSYDDIGSAVEARNDYIKKNGLKLKIQTVPPVTLCR